MAGVLRGGWCWEQQQRDVFCLAQVAVSRVQTYTNTPACSHAVRVLPACRFGRAVCPCSLPALQDEYAVVEQ